MFSLEMDTGTGKMGTVGGRYARYTERVTTDGDTAEMHKNEGCQRTTK